MDFGFNHAYAPMIMRAVYSLAPLGLAIVWAAVTVGGFMWTSWAGFVGLIIVGPVIMVGGLIILRVLTELIILAFKAGDDLTAMRKQGEEVA